MQSNELSMRVLLVDDEPLARRNIRLLLKPLNFVEVAGEAADGFEAVRLIEELRPDLVFLDIRMPEMTGLEVVTQLPESRMPYFVFITAHEDYAIEAFEHHALDYVLKPFTKERFASTLERARRKLQADIQLDLNNRMLQALQSIEQHQSRNATQQRYLRRILVSRGDRIHFVDVDDIIWIESVDYYVNIHTENGEYLHRESLNNLEQNLNPNRFVRIHRSTIVNVEQIREILNDGPAQTYCITRTGKLLKISKARRVDVLSAFSHGN